MSNIVTMQTPSPLRPRDYSPEQMALIRRTVAADTTADEFNMFIEIAKRAGLDPFRRQLYCIVFSKDNPDKRKVTFITGIDGFRAVAARNRDYRPDDVEPVIVYDNDLKGPTNPLGIVKASVKAFKMAASGEWFPLVGTAYWSEFAPVKDEWAWSEEKKKRVPTGLLTLDPSGNWFKMGRVMICKCAESQALRKGWPEDLSGIYSPEEMDVSTMRDITPTDAVEQHETQLRLQRIGAKDAISMLWQAGEPIEAVPVGQMVDRCLAHIKAADSITGLEWWWATNEVSLRTFWAMHKSDALAVKAAHEARKVALAE